METEKRSAAAQNPFSRERAWLTFQENMREAARLREEVRQGKETGQESDRELLLKATEALGRLTDNTILLKVVQRALEARENT